MTCQHHLLPGVQNTGDINEHSVFENRIQLHHFQHWQDGKKQTWPSEQLEGLLSQFLEKKKVLGFYLGWEDEQTVMSPWYTATAIHLCQTLHTGVWLLVPDTES